MGYMIATGHCLGCGRIFSFNPERVPSCQGEPICGACVVRVNPLRLQNGLEPIVPLPGAYNAQEAY